MKSIQNEREILNHLGPKLLLLLNMNQTRLIQLSLRQSHSKVSKRMLSKWGKTAANLTY